MMEYGLRITYFLFLILSSRKTDNRLVDCEKIDQVDVKAEAFVLETGKREDISFNISFFQHDFILSN